MVRGRKISNSERMVTDTYQIEPTVLDMMRKAVTEHPEMFRSKADLIRRGVYMVLKQYGYVNE